MGDFLIIYIKNSNEIDDVLDEKQRKYNINIKKIIFKIKQISCKINIYECQYGKILTLPYIRKIKKNKKNKILKKIYNIIKLYENNNQVKIVLSNELSENEKVMNFLKEKKLQLLNGRNIFKMLAYETIEYIVKLKNIDIEKQDVSILLNNLNNNYYEVIMKIAKKVKSIKIVTNNINQFKKLESDLYKVGINIIITNNKRKSIEKSNLILNFDFDEETLNQYRLYRKAIVINYNEKNEIISKGFCGINANFIKIKSNNSFCEKSKADFNYTILYESTIIEIEEIAKIQEQIKEDVPEICGFFGKNGIINEKEIIELK